MKNWKKYFFSDFVTVNPLVSLKANQEYSFIEMKDLSDGQKFAYPSIQRKLTGGARFEEGDTLFARITPCLENGKICRAKNLIDGKGFGSTEFLIFRGKDGISNNDFVFYLSRWDKVRRYAEANLVGTSGRQRVSKDVFQKLELELPNLPTQSRIASILSSLDDKIELNRRMNQTLEQIAQALFNHYFVDNIDPDNLPEGWKKGELGEALSFRNGKYSPARDDDFSFPVFGSNGVIGYCDETNCKEDSFIIGRVGSFCGSVYFTLEKAYVTDNAIIAESKIKNSLAFCYQLLRMLNLNNFKGGSGQPLVNQSVLSNIDIILPPINKIDKYEMVAFDFYKKIYQNEKENKALSTIRDTLLPKLMSGEIDVDALMKEETQFLEQTTENFKSA